MSLPKCSPASNLDGYTVIADKGFAGNEFEALISQLGGRLLRPDRKDEPTRFGSLGGIRQWIESTFNTLKDQLSLERHGARTLPGLITRIGRRLLTLAAALSQLAYPTTRPKPHRLRPLTHPTRSGRREAPAPRGIADWGWFSLAPHRTVHEVLPHTAHRHPSPGRVRGTVDASDEWSPTEEALLAQPPVAVGPRTRGLVARPDPVCQPLGHVEVELVELGRGVAPALRGRPAPCT